MPPIMHSSTYFDRLDKFLSVGFQFPFAFVKLVRAGRYNTPRANCSFRDVPVGRKHDKLKMKAEALAR